jgi:hypothetical protein
VDLHNQQVEAAARLPGPQLIGDVNILRRAREIRLVIPSDWRARLKQVPERRKHTRDELAESIARDY